MKATLTALICLLLTGCTGIAKQENAAEATAEPAMIADANFAFSFPIKYYEITPGKYRISKPLYQYGQKINLKAEFDIE